MTTFTQWIREREHEGFSLAAATSKDTKTKRDRDRLTRMETMLRELIRMKEVVSGRTDYALN